MARKGQAPREWDDEVRAAVRRIRRRRRWQNPLKILIGIGFLSGALVITLLLLPDSVMSGLRKTWNDLRATATALSTTTPHSLPSAAVATIQSSQVEASRPEPTAESGPRGLLTSEMPAFGRGVLPTGVPATLTPPKLKEMSERLVKLRALALDLINQDRSDHDLPPVALGSNVAAQLHAEDMLQHDYNGHWWIDGRKPYMVYSQTGGTSYVSENVASSGFTKQLWDENNCDSFLVNCVVSEPDEEVERAEWDMMYDDAGSSWGHRDNILGSTHRFVNLGIAWNERRMIFVQHFEGGDVAANSPPQLGTDGTLSLKLIKLANGLQIGSTVSIYYDPPPRQKTPAQIDELDSYCLGGGFTTICAEPIARVLRPAPPGSFYSGLEPDEVIAEVWNENSDEFSFVAKLGSLATDPGVYTVVVWRDSGPLLSEAVLELSTIQQ